jgi:NAD-dependent DNA ligase
LEKTVHNIPLLSLDKTKQSGDLMRFIGSHQVLLMHKLDGLTLFDTVEIDGCDVSRASLHDLTFIKDLELMHGCRILVSKRNMIIPHVEENLDRGRFNRKSIFMEGVTNYGNNRKEKRCGEQRQYLCWAYHRGYRET